MNDVHYLIRTVGRNRGLYYPIEVADQTHDTRGSFYLMGREDDEPERSYNFWAIREGVLIQTTLIANDDRPQFFAVSVADIGIVPFYAEPLTLIPYVGQYSSLRRFFSLRRLRAVRLLQLESASQQHDFYFVGYSPQIELPGKKR